MGEMTAKCTTCATVFRACERDEDGAPELPGQLCADPACGAWICDGGCAEHLSFVCDGCAGRFCGFHRIAIDGLNCCCVCAAECEPVICVKRKPVLVYTTAFCVNRHEVS
jgi:hypothetical protein